MSLLSGLAGEFPSHDAFLDQSDIVALLQSEQFSDLVGSLRAQSSGDVGIGKPRNVRSSLLRDRKRNHGHVVTHDAPSDRTSGSLTGSSRSVAFLVLVQQKSNSALFILMFMFMFIFIFMLMFMF